MEDKKFTCISNESYYNFIHWHEKICFFCTVELLFLVTDFVSWTEIYFNWLRWWTISELSNIHWNNEKIHKQFGINTFNIVGNSSIYILRKFWILRIQHLLDNVTNFLKKYTQYIYESKLIQIPIYIRGNFSMINENCN